MGDIDLDNGEKEVNLIKGKIIVAAKAVFLASKKIEFKKKENLVKVSQGLIQKNHQNLQIVVPVKDLLLPVFHRNHKIIILGETTKGIKKKKKEDLNKKIIKKMKKRIKMIQEKKEIILRLVQNLGQFHKNKKIEKGMILVKTADILRKIEVSLLKADQIAHDQIVDEINLNKEFKN
jgi:2-succinyl-5-enolpyruvyl-6-hydroxy-3-cyclohexene-1-carboxylate synthase